MLVRLASLLDEAVRFEAAVTCQVVSFGFCHDSTEAAYLWACQKGVQDALPIAPVAQFWFDAKAYVPCLIGFNVKLEMAYRQVIFLDHPGVDIGFIGHKIEPGLRW